MPQEKVNGPPPSAADILHSDTAPQEKQTNYRYPASGQSVSDFGVGLVKSIPQTLEGIRQIIAAAPRAPTRRIGSSCKGYDSTR